MSKKKKETKEVALVPNKEVESNEDVVNKEEKQIPLIDQLNTHVEFLKTGKKTLIGYSLLFSEEVDEEIKGENEDDAIEVKTVTKHGMATSYPDILNHLLLGFHTNSITNEEVGFMQIIANEIAYKIMNLDKVNPVSENEMLENEKGKN